MNDLQWHNALGYAHLVDAASQQEDGAVNAEPIRAFFGDAERSYRVLAAIQVNDLASDLNPQRHEAIVPIGLVAQHLDGELVIALRGTRGIHEWLHDCAYYAVHCPIAPDAGFTEDGFTACFRSLRLADEPHAGSLAAQLALLQTPVPVTRVTVCGHSLGAALATLLALDLAINTALKPVTLYTFASPRIGDERFAHFFAEHVQDAHRIANRADIVTLTPPGIASLRRPYVHVESLSPLAPHSRVSLHIACMHHLSTYLFLMRREAGLEEDPSLLHPKCFAEAVEEMV
jgi:hypothetical protein